MAKLVSTLLATIFLVAGSAPIIAQDRTANPPGCTSCVSQQDFERLKAQQQKTAARVGALSNNVRSLNATQAQQENQIISMRVRVTDQGTAIRETNNALGKTNKAMADVETTIHLMVHWAKTIFVVVLLFVLGAACFVWRILSAMKKRGVKESVIVNPDVITLRALCQKLRDEDPNGDHRITFMYRLSPHPEKGFLEGGDVEGYVAVFEGHQDLADQQPTIYYGGDVLKLKELPKHAARVLGLTRSTPPQEPSPQLAH